MDGLEALAEYLNETLEAEGKCVLKVYNASGYQYYKNEDRTEGSYSAETVGQLLQTRNDLVCKYFYVYPGIPSREVIYSDERLPGIGELRLLPVYPYGRAAGPDEIQRAFEKEYNGDFRKFSRWYLVEVSKDPAMLSPVSYVKYAAFRDGKHRVITIREGKKIYKIPENRETLPHIYQIKKIYESMVESGIPAMQIQIENDVVQTEFCEGPRWDEFIIEQFRRGGEKQLWKELDKVEKFFQGISKKKQFENPYDEDLMEIYPEGAFVLKAALMDGNINNIMLNAGTPFFIDQEWITRKELPADYLLYFSLLHLSKLLEGIREEDLMERYRITPRMQRLFLNIYRNYYGKAGLENDEAFGFDNHSCI